MTRVFFLFFLIPSLFCAALESEPVQVELISESAQAVPGKEQWLALRFTLDPEWHLYGEGHEMGFPPSIEWKLPENCSLSPLYWPAATEEGTYEGELWLLAKLFFREGEAKEPLSIEGSVKWLACSDSMCLPGEKQVSLRLPLAREAEGREGLFKEEFAAALAKLSPGALEEGELLAYREEGAAQLRQAEGEPRFLAALFFAFLGGMILNLMPCVLPVLSLKVFAFVKMGSESRVKVIQHGLFFTLGVLASFWLLAALLLVLRGWGHAVGWGFQLQEPLFVAILSAIVFILSLSLFGVFELGTGVASWAGGKEQKAASAGGGGFSAFFSGVLATAVATPCTGPFLGSAVGFAVTLPPLAALAIFSSLGCGMASPYLLLACFPRLTRYMPKPGGWMITFKEILGFLMLATVIWLVWVFGSQTSITALTALFIAYFFFAVACWLWGKWGSPVKKRSTRISGAVASFALFSFGLFFLGEASLFEEPRIEIEESGGLIALSEGRGEAAELEKWHRFDPQRLQALTERGVPVLVDFTAKWCLICQANHLVLSGGEISGKMRELGVVKMKADWTKRDPVITEALSRFGRSGVPLYLLYTGLPGKEPLILPQVLTKDLLKSSLERIQKPAADAD